MLTEEGTIFSWGKNEHGFLGREAKIDIKAIGTNDKRKKLAFSTFTPGKISKLEKYKISKIKISDGKFYAFFADYVLGGEDEDALGDSEIDSEEEKD